MKIFYFLFSFLLILSYTGGFSSQSSYAKEADGDSYVTDVNFTRAGTELKDGDTLGFYDVYRVTYNFKLPNDTFEMGDKLKFSIPKEFEMADNIEITILKDDNEVAKMRSKKNEDGTYYLELEFTTNYVEEHSNITGKMTVETKINWTYVTSNDIIINFPSKEYKFKKYEFNPGGGETPGDPTLEVKRGSVNLTKMQGGTQENLFSWKVGIGRDLLLTNGKTFDDIESIIFSDEPEDQEVISKNKIYGYSSDSYLGYVINPDYNVNYLNTSKVNITKKVDGKELAFSIDILDIIKTADDAYKKKDKQFNDITIIYSSRPLSKLNYDFDYKNEAKITINYKDGSKPSELVLKGMSKWTVGAGEMDGETSSVKLKKVDGKSNAVLKGAKFDLYKVDENNKNILYKENLLSDNNGIVYVTKLAVGNYYFVETEAPAGYKINQDKLSFVVTQENITKGAVIEAGTLKNTKDDKSVTVKKEWKDDNDSAGKRPVSVEVQLYGDNEKIGETQFLTELNDWTFTWSDLEKEKNGEAIDYKVEEVNLPKDYKVASNKETSTGYFEILNEYINVEKKITGTKTWDDKENLNKDRPSEVGIHLFADGVKVASQKIDASNDWKYEFTKLPVFNQGEKIQYTIKEEPIKHYEPVYTENDFQDVTTNYNEYNQILDVKNIYKPEKITHQVIKEWDDENDNDRKRPSEIKVQLLADGKGVGNPVVLKETDNWMYTWTNLPEKENGSIIKYTTKEIINLAGYYSNVEEDTTEKTTTIINSYVPEKTEVSGQKVWEDDNNRDGKRPSEIKLQLLANGEVINSKIVTAADNWQYTFSNLYRYIGGEEVQYELKETPVDGYTIKRDDNDIKNLNRTEKTEISSKGRWGTGTMEGYTIDITNVYTPEKTEVSGQKIWEDDNNRDKKRPEKIRIYLMANGVQVDSKEITETDNWKYKFDELPKFEKGLAVNYTVVEGPVKDYIVNQNHFDLTNIYIPEKTSRTVTKTWEDDNNRDGKRLDKIEVQLYGNGKEVGTPVAVTESDNWQFTWSELPEKENGKTIDYTIKELTTIENYKVDIDSETTPGTFTIKNSMVPEKTKVNGQKIWEDDNNRDGKRPQALTIYLVADGVEVASQTVTAADDWKYNFENLPKNNKGIKIDYKLKEQAIPGYEATVTDNNITNTYIPEKIDIAGTKNWNDNDNEAGERPEKITVYLMANSIQVDSKEVSKKDEWKYIFKDKPKYENGVLINYQITEGIVEGYTPEFENYDITNTYTPDITSRMIMKAWDDEENQSGKRPEEIKVQLYANDKEVGKPITIHLKDEWKYIWSNLPEKQKGEIVKYSVKEIGGLSKYKIKVDSASIPGTFIVTNSEEIEMTAVTGKKTWDDDNNKNEKRPEKITVNLFGNGIKVAMKEVNEQEEWKYEFDELPKYKDGEKIIYTVTEELLEDYTVMYDGYNITNKYNPNKMSATILKEWEDEGDESLRPEFIEVQLYANGQKAGEKVKLTEKEGWKYTWNELLATQDGEKIIYTVKELTEVEGYMTTVDNTNPANLIVKNKFTPTDIPPYEGKVPPIKTDVPSIEDAPPIKTDVPSIEDVPPSKSDDTLIEKIIPKSISSSGSTTAKESNNPAVSVDEPNTATENPKYGAQSYNKTDSSGNLPQTGMAEYGWYVLVGATIVIFAFILMGRRKTK